MRDIVISNFQSPRSFFILLLLFLRRATFDPLAVLQFTADGFVTAGNHLLPFFEAGEDLGIIVVADPAPGAPCHLAPGRPPRSAWAAPPACDRLWPASLHWARSTAADGSNSTR